MRRFVSIGPALVVLLAVLAVMAAAPAALRQVDLARLAASVLMAQDRLDRSAALEQANQGARDVADAVLPGVVHIQVRTPGRFADNEAPEGGENPQPEQPRQRRTWPRASAAGWFFNDQGFIVTNAHVVDEAEELRVELYDGRVRTARLIGADPLTDIAVIKIDVDNTLPLRRASKDPVRIGDRVFVFGSPFGIKFSMSQGIVSGVGRSEAASFVGMRQGYTNFIQTDAAMNPGNSGGPAVDVNGRVVGMAAAIANNTQFSFGEQRFSGGQSAGIGFAIPIETIESVVAQLMDSAIILRGYLGVSLSPSLSPEIARELDIGYDGFGVPVNDVRQGQPADKGGLRRRDVILAVNEQPTPNSDVVRSMISIRAPGEQVRLKLWRDGQIIDLPLRVGSAFGDRLEYIPGSEDMTTQQVRAKVLGQPADPKPD